MAIKNTVNLGTLGISDWLESYRLAAAPAMNAEGPLNPNTHEVVARDVIPGPYPEWHYQALAMLRLLEAADEQRGRIEALESEVKDLRRAIGALIASLIHGGGMPTVGEAEELGLGTRMGSADGRKFPPRAAEILKKYRNEADFARGRD